MSINCVFVLGVYISLIHSTTSDTCAPRWTKVYENGPNGEPIDGSKSKLLRAASSGASIKVISNNDYITSIQNVYPIKDELCAQALFHISKADYNTFQDNALWWVVNMCTTGHWYMAHYNVGEHVSRGDSEVKYNMKWFVRLGNNSPVLKTFNDGTVGAGSVSNVVTAIKNGWDIKITDCSRGYTMPVDNLQHNQDESKVAGQALWHVSQKASADGKRYIFQENAYWWFTIWSTSGYRDISRWSLGQHQSRGHTHDNVAMKWFAYSCWKLSYRHDENGNPLEGSLTEFVRAVENGHKVKMVYDNESIEVSFVGIRNGHINAQVLNSVSKSNLSQFKDDAYWYWRIASTTGSVKTVRYRVGIDTYVSGPTLSNKAISWFIDRRGWKKVLNVANNGTVTSGSKARLEYAVRNGADVRYRLQFSSPDAIVVQADNLAINSDGNIGAMNVRSVSVSSDGLSELKFQSNPYWWFTITDTNGKVDMGRWTIGKHVDRGHSNDQANVVWFMSE